MPLTVAQNCPPSLQTPIIDPNHESFHGCIRGPVAVSRLKGTKSDSHLVRYSEKQKKLVLTVLKRGLGQDEDGDLVMEFEIVVSEDGKRCKVNGSSRSCKSLDELLKFCQCTTLHPSVTGIGGCCVSPRYREGRERKEMLASQASQASTSRMLSQLQAQDQQYQRQLDEMQAKIRTLEREKKSRCTIQ